MLIANEQIKKILLEKKIIVEQGRELNKKIDEEASKIGDEFVKLQGLNEERREGETIIYSGSFADLKKVFSVETLTLLNDKVEEKLSKELKEIKKLEHLIAKLNEKVTQIIDDEVRPTVKLEEFQRFGRVELLENGKIELEIYDIVEEFKERIRSKTNAN